MIKLLSSEWLRAKRTAVQWLTLCMPIIFSLCVVFYLTTKSGSTQEFAFEGFFTVWTVFIIPIGVGILAGFIVQEEELAGNFNGFLCVGISRVRLYSGKISFSSVLPNYMHIYCYVDTLHRNEYCSAIWSNNMVIPVSSRTCGDWDTSTISYSSLGEFCMGYGCIYWY